MVFDNLLIKHEWILLLFKCLNKESSFAESSFSALNFEVLVYYCLLIFQIGSNKIKKKKKN